MRLTFCVACGERAAEKLEYHHIIPRSEGGCDLEFNILTLCGQCHGLVHKMKRASNHRDLTIKGLQAAKARGVKMGGYRGYNLSAADCAAGAVIRQAAAKERAADLAPILAQLQAEGATSLGALAKALTERKIPTARGEANWSPMQVSRVLKLVGGE